MNTASARTNIPETATAETFNQDPYQFLIVANKFQTGFNQPLLVAMYVDKRLGGVNAVQTLSRLNRTYPQKNSTIVLDFANEAATIQSAFEVYYDRTALTTETDPNLLYDIQYQLEDFELYTDTDVDNFARIYYDPKATQDKLHAILTPVIDRYQATTEEEQFAFRNQLKDFVRLYAFISQLLSIPDGELEKLYEFSRHLARKLPISSQRLPIEVQQSIALESYRIQQTHTGRIPLTQGIRELDLISAGISQLPIEAVEPLSQILQQLNQQFGTNFAEDERVFIQQIETKLDRHEALKASIQVNSSENVRLTFNTIINDIVQDLFESNFQFYRQFNDNRDFAQYLLNVLFQRYLEKTTQNNEQNVI